jgi:hypothetical protein
METNMVVAAVLCSSLPGSRVAGSMVADAVHPDSEKKKCIEDRGSLWLRRYAVAMDNYIIEAMYKSELFINRASGKMTSCRFCHFEPLLSFRPTLVTSTHPCHFDRREKSHRLENRDFSLSLEMTT